MPRLSIWLIGAALTWLLVGAAAGAIVLVTRGNGGYEFTAWLLPLHIELMLVGWAVQFAMGVAYWILPRRKTGGERGNETLAWGSFGLLNVAVLVAALAGAGRLPIVLITVGRIGEVAAAVMYAFNAWRRLPRSLTAAGRAVPTR